MLYEKISFDLVEWWFFIEGFLPPPLDPVIAVIDTFLIIDWNGNKDSWAVSAKQPGLDMLEDFFMSSIEFSINPYWNLLWMSASKFDL